MSPSALVQSEHEHELKHRTSIPEQPITERNKPLAPESEVDEKGKVNNYAVPRANVAATREAPNGTEKDKYNYHNRKKTVGWPHQQGLAPKTMLTCFEIGPRAALRLLRSRQ